jgi:hypothetical protein
VFGYFCDKKVVGVFVRFHCAASFVRQFVLVPQYGLSAVPVEQELVYISVLIVLPLRF